MFGNLGSPELASSGATPTRPWSGWRPWLGVAGYPLSPPLIHQDGGTEIGESILEELEVVPAPQE